MIGNLGGWSFKISRNIHKNFGEVGCLGEFSMIFVGFWEIHLEFEFYIF